MPLYETPSIERRRGAAALAAEADSCVRGADADADAGGGGGGGGFRPSPPSSCAEMLDGPEVRVASAAIGPLLLLPRAECRRGMLLGAGPGLAGGGAVRRAAVPTYVQFSASSSGTPPSLVLAGPSERDGPLDDRPRLIEPPPPLPSLHSDATGLITPEASFSEVRPLPPLPPPAGRSSICCFLGSATAIMYR